MPSFNITGPDGKKYRVTGESAEGALNALKGHLGTASDTSTGTTGAQPRSGQHLSFEEGQALLEQEEQQQRANSLSGMLGAAGSSYLEDTPIVGPALIGTAQRGAAVLSSAITGESYDDKLKEAQAITERAQEANPVASLAGGVAGNIAALAPLGSTAIGARALGITGPSLLGRAGMSAATSAGISGADTVARGGDASDVINNSVIGFAAGGAIPLLGSAIETGVRAIGNRVYPAINSLRNPAGEAERRLGEAIKRDAANPTAMLNSVDEAVARQNNIPLVNADRGGETTRALARSVSNQSPEARAAIENTASDRFAMQSQRSADFIKRIAGGNVDDLGYQEMIKAAARKANQPAYKAAFEDPAAQMLYTKGLQELMQSPSIRRAVAKVPARSADRGAVDGFREIGNPFVQNSRGDFVLRQKADGTIVGPNLQFWDQVKRNLDSEIGKAKRAGDNALAADMMGLKTKLLTELDNTVDSYRAARQGAAAFFGAEDALDAGRSFANTPRAIPEAKKAFSKFTKPEKDSFATGYASELIDKIKASGDRTNVINSTFKSQASRESMELVFGPQKAKEIEAYVRVEDLADRLRGALGNSTTARQLVELGIGAGAGGLYTGDLSGAVAGAALAKGARYLGERADAKVMENVAKLLMQDNPLALRSAVATAARTPAYMDALERLSGALAIPSRAAAISAGQ